MKKIFYLLSICALALVSCNKEEAFKLEQTADGQYVYRFTVNNGHAAWKAGDQVAVYQEDGTILGLAELSSSSVGQTSGAFSLTVEPLLADGTKLVFKYPYVEEADAMTGKIADKQTSLVGGAGAGANGLATADVTFAQQNLVVNLAPIHAYVKLNVSSSAFADYNLDGATFWAAESQLAGNITYVRDTVAAKDVMTITKTSDYVKTTIAEPAAVGSGVNGLMLAALPADLTGKTVWAIVHMSKGIETVTLPVQITEPVVLQAGAVKEIELANLTTASAPSWYQPVETRYIAVYGDGWSYGPENTVLFPTKSAAKPVELKARGNFMKVKEPAYVQIQYACDQSDGQKAGYVKFDGAVDAYNGSAYIEHAIGNDYSVDVAILKAYSADVNGQISAMLVKDADKNVIWGINLWACFNPIETVKYNNGDVLTYNIGSSVSAVTYANWKSNGSYFQWGRPWAFSWSSNLTNNNKELVVERQTFEYTMTKPFTYFYYSGNPYNWFWDNRFEDGKSDINDLWGNPDGENNPGVKSNYDPCPKGYRVVSPAVLAEVETGLIEKVKTTTSPNYVLHEGVDWPFAGAYLGGVSGTALSKAGNNNTTYMCAYWSNSNSGSNGRLMSYQPSAAEDKRILTARAKGAATPIRCMIDTENR